MHCPVFAALLLTTLSVMAAEDPFPGSAPADRYAKSLAQSPFALATKVEAPAAPQESFAANWNITGLSRLPDENGVQQDFVTIRSRDGRVAFSLLGEEESNDPDAKGVAISQVNRSPDVRKSTVLLKLGSRTARVEFGQDVAAPTGMPAPPQQTGGAPRPTYLPNAGVNAARPSYGPGAGPAPVNRGGAVPGRPNNIPRPTAGPPGVPVVGGGQMSATNGPGAPAATGAQLPQDGHRRVRIIPTTQ